MNIITPLAVLSFVIASLYLEISAVLPNIVMGMLT